MFNFRKLQAPLRQICMVAKMLAKPHLIQVIQRRDEIVNPSVPFAIRFSGILMANQNRESNEMCKVKSASAADSTNTMQEPIQYGLGLWTIDNQVLAGKVDSIASLRDNRESKSDNFVDAAVGSHLYLLLLIMDSTPLQIMVSAGDSTSSTVEVEVNEASKGKTQTQAKKGNAALILPEENSPSFMNSFVKSSPVVGSCFRMLTARIMADGSYLWKRKDGEEKEPEGARVEGAGVGGWIIDLTSNTFLEAFQLECTKNYKHPSTGLVEYVAQERAYKRLLTHPDTYDRVVFVSDSETFLLEFDECLKFGRYPKLPRRGVPAYEEKLACYHSLKRLLKEIPPGTAIKLEKIRRAKNKLPDLLSKMGRITEKRKVYRSVQQIKEEYEKAKAEKFKLPKIDDREWGNLTKIPPTSGYGFIVWNPKR